MKGDHSAEVQYRAAILPTAKLLNLFCLSLINHAASNPDAALYALIKFVMYVQKFPGLMTLH